MRMFSVSALKMLLVSFLLSLANNSQIEHLYCKCLFIKKPNRNYMLLIISCVIRILQDFLLIGLLSPIQYYLRSEESPRGLWLFSILPTSKPHLESWNFSVAYIFFKKQQNTACLDLFLWYQKKLTLNDYRLIQLFLYILFYYYHSN